MASDISVSNFEQACRNIYAYWTYVRDDEENVKKVDLDAVQDGLTTLFCFCYDRFGGAGAVFDTPDEGFREMVDAALIAAGLS